ncbi:MAG TPA: hypothetical protein VI461_05355 [Chitinophagaceae bacterium]|nr:hypothetical protein [Chitinophagaceae bacterium]
MKKIFIVFAIACSLIACMNEGEKKSESKDSSTETPLNSDTSPNKPDNTNTTPQSDSPANEPGQNMLPDTTLMRRPHQ